MGRVNNSWLHLLIVLSLAIMARSAEDDCVYTLYIRTGSILKAGTDSNISVTLFDVNRSEVAIGNVVEWGGLMGPGYNYFERGNLDIFSGRGRCLSGPVCAMNVTSDDSGSHAGWYCNYVEVTSTGAHIPCTQQLFTVEQWLALDASPYNLTAFRNSCASLRNGDHHFIDGSRAAVM